MMALLFASGMTLLLMMSNFWFPLSERLFRSSLPMNRTDTLWFLTRADFLHAAMFALAPSFFLFCLLIVVSDLLMMVRVPVLTEWVSAFRKARTVVSEPDLSAVEYRPAAAVFDPGKQRRDFEFNWNREAAVVLSEQESACQHKQELSEGAPK